MEKINSIKKTQAVDSGSGFIIKIDAPFFDSPLKKLVLVEMKMWDGTTDQCLYMKQRISAALESETRGGRKKLMAFMQI